MSLRQKAFHDTHNYGLGGGDYSGTGGKDIKQRIRVVNSGGKCGRQSGGWKEKRQTYNRIWSYDDELEDGLIQ